MIDYYAIGQRIRQIRKARGLSQDQLAEQVGISTVHVSHIENANTKLSLPVFVRLTEVLQVPADELLQGAAPVRRQQAEEDILRLLEAWGCRTVWRVVLNGLVWCGGILVQARLARQSMGRELAWELLSSLVFSLGCGYVFYRSGRLLFSAAAHAAERFLVTKLDR